MNDTQNAVTIKLDACCLRTLGQIKDVTKNIAMLRNLMAASPFILMLGSSPLENVINVTTGDWTLYAKAVKSTSNMQKATIKRIAGMEILKHRGGPLNKFWKNIYNNA